MAQFGPGIVHLEAQRLQILVGGTYTSLKMTLCDTDAVREHASLPLLALSGRRVPEYAISLVHKRRPSNPLSFLERWMSGGLMLALVKANSVFRVLLCSPRFPE